MDQEIKTHIPDQMPDEMTDTALKKIYAAIDEQKNKGQEKQDKVETKEKITADVKAILNQIGKIKASELELLSLQQILDIVCNSNPLLTGPYLSGSLSFHIDLESTLFNFGTRSFIVLVHEDPNNDGKFALYYNTHS